MVVAFSTCAVALVGLSNKVWLATGHFESQHQASGLYLMPGAEGKGEDELKLDPVHLPQLTAPLFCVSQFRRDFVISPVHQTRFQLVNRDVRHGIGVSLAHLTDLKLGVGIPSDQRVLDLALCSFAC